MLVCQNCGQCKHINDEDFYEIRYTSGWERNTVDCEQGDYVDYQEGETTETDHDRFECPHCESDDIEEDVDEDDFTEEQAFGKRNAWEARRKGQRVAEEVKKNTFTGERIRKGD